MVKPGIKTPEDLRNKKFGIPNIGGTVWMGRYSWLWNIQSRCGRDKISISRVGDLRTCSPKRWNPAPSTRRC